MPAPPRLSLCLPSSNRAVCFKEVLEGALLEAATCPPGTVEVLVCLDSSTEEMTQLLARLQEHHPELRVFWNPEPLGPDRNALRCVEAASGEYLWILKENDQWLAGCLARVWRELDAGADVCLCLAQSWEDSPEAQIPSLYLSPDPPLIWHLDQREDLVRYFNTCAHTTGAFAFLGSVILRRAALLVHWESIQGGVGTGYVHLWGILDLLRRPACLHYIPQALVRCSAREGDSDRLGDWIREMRIW